MATPGLVTRNILAAAGGLLEEPAGMLELRKAWQPSPGSLVILNKHSTVFDQAPDLHGRYWTYNIKSRFTVRDAIGLIVASNLWTCCVYVRASFLWTPRHCVKEVE